MPTHLIMCCHNGGDYVQAQLASIFTQSEPIDQFHIFDFASTDDTVARIEEAFRILAPLRPYALHRQPDSPGPALSFFRAFAQIQPLVQDDDCIFIADQDDVWLPGKMQAMNATFRKEIANTPSGMLAMFHDVQIVDSSLKPLQTSFYTGNPYQVPRDLAADRLLLCNPVVGHTLAVSGKLLRYVCQHATPRHYLMHDWAIVLWASRAGRIAWYGKEPLSLYRQHTANILGAHRRRPIAEQILRTRRFTVQVTQQALGFAKDLKRAPAASLSPNDQKWLLLTDSGQLTWRGRIFLAQLALRTGPTLKRKVLSAFLLFQPSHPQHSTHQQENLPAPQKTADTFSSLEPVSHSTPSHAGHKPLAIRSTLQKDEPAS